ncbi:Hypothetical protein PFR_JS21-2_1948 [Propionibacterium freudenreichii]|uniref:hypothetical protein n=2 Tax=Propionibacterium freudenreichii TaxID=1744 RepID=UPI000542AD03|nr:hypothetical protein [Propionibacterium freudenreichii]AJQ90068.1 Hypothetical protein RM25_0336 [Propionibacterium freudenreichii subsp. freudenreichii]MCT2977123.1 hypothetical protein [Propionibacterium freudenreichii]MCT2978533.1 hypothetical protein [Propionibacterium freudenreichii]MCT2983944.1 hypothetical protein [Propionibacterium freudenreichii]MCT2987489.1 hypothetical protein [Propionibacterium freudenreichii]
MMSTTPDTEPTTTGRAHEKITSTELVPIAPAVKHHLSATPPATRTSPSRGHLEALREQLAQGDLSIDDAARLTREYIDNI